MAQRLFGESCAGRLERLLESADDPDRPVDVGEWIIDYENGDALLARVRKWASQSGA